MPLLWSQYQTYLAAIFYWIILLMNPIYQQTHVLIQQGKFSEALNALNILLAKNPKDLNALNLLGSLHLQQNNLENALAIFKKAEIIGPDIVPIIYNIAFILMSLERHE